MSVNKNLSSPLLPGESLSLNCEVETPQNHKRPEVKWLSPENREYAQERVTVKVTGKDNGKWICAVKQDNKENKATVSVKVVGESIYTYAFV